MKIGVLSYEHQKLALDGRDWQNIGDYIQSYAMYQILQEMNLTDQIDMVSKFELDSYDGDYIFLMMNSFNNLLNQAYLQQTVYPISKKIIPFYISYNLHSSMPEEVADFFRMHEPIGCRDEFTMLNMRKHNIRSYLSGCVTALMPRCAKVPSNGKILFIDTPKSLEPYVPTKLRDRIEYASHLVPIQRTTGEHILTKEESKEIWEYTKKRMEYYQNEVSLVVTSRLHASVPCMAMGLPVIVVHDNTAGIFAWLDKFLPLYSPHTFKDIDWNPAPVEYEEEKAYMKKIFKKQIQQKYDEIKDIYDLSSFYEKREKCVYHETIKSYIEQVPIDHSKPIKYVIWGTVNKSTIIKNAIDMYFPHWQLTHAVDLKCQGQFECLDIEKPDIIDHLEDDLIYIVVPDSAHKPVSKLLQEKGKKYILLNYTVCEWSDNIDNA